MVTCYFLVVLGSWESEMGRSGVYGFIGGVDVVFEVEKWNEYL